MKVQNGKPAPSEGRFARCLIAPPHQEGGDFLRLGYSWDIAPPALSPAVRGVAGAKTAKKGLIWMIMAGFARGLGIQFRVKFIKCLAQRRYLAPVLVTLARLYVCHIRVE